MLVLLTLAPHLSGRSPITLDWAVKSLLLWPQKQYPILAPGWSLTYELYFYLIFAAVCLVPVRFVPWAFGIWGLATLLAYPAYDQPGYADTNDLQQLPLYASPLALEFIAGVGIGWCFVHKRMKYGRFVLGLGIIWFCLGGPAWEAILERNAEYGHTRLLSYGVAAAMIVYGCLSRESLTQVYSHKTTLSDTTFIPKIAERSFKILSHLGDSSYRSLPYPLVCAARRWPRRTNASRTWKQRTIDLLADRGVCGDVVRKRCVSLHRAAHVQLPSFATLTNVYASTKI
ncbi:MAG: hypothetical protein R3C28_31015 [Pirellulaceae bacterium]